MSDIPLDPKALERAMEGAHLAVHEQSFFTDEISTGRYKMQRAQAIGTIAAYLEALVESGKAKMVNAWVSDNDGIFDTSFEPHEGTSPAIIIRLDGEMP